MRLPNKTIEKKLFDQGYEQVVGVDEVGMGCLAGPVVVCAAAFNKSFFKKIHKNLRWLRDSKLLLPYQREKFAKELLKEKNLQFKIAYCFPKTIDKINIYQAARKAMRRAVRELINYQSGAQGNSFSSAVEKNFVHRSPSRYLSRLIVLVDGPHKIDDLKIEQIAIIKGDQKVFVIACASILAKVFRDKMMIKYAKKFPGYGFEKHKGYGTKEHLACLSALGPCLIHRRSFARLSFWTSENNTPWRISPKI